MASESSNKTQHEVDGYEQINHNPLLNALQYIPANWFLISYFSNTNFHHYNNIIVYDGKHEKHFAVCDGWLGRGSREKYP